MFGGPLPLTDHLRPALLVIFRLDFTRALGLRFLVEPAFNLPLLFPESSFMGVQTPEYMALIGQPIETLDQWSQSAIIGNGVEKPHPEARV